MYEEEDEKSVKDDGGKGNGSDGWMTEMNDDQLDAAAIESDSWQRCIVAWSCILNDKKQYQFKGFAPITVWVLQERKQKRKRERKRSKKERINLREKRKRIQMKSTKS